MLDPLPRPDRPASRPLRFAWLYLLAAAPVAYVVTQTILASRNIAYWDDYDSVLGFLLHLRTGRGWGEFFQLVFQLDSEHRTVTSRLLTASLYWLTGGVNFHLLGLIGNLCFAGLCVVLVVAAGGRERRLRLGVVLALGLFHLEQYESFFWGGASIDHFQILLLAAGALAALARDTRRALLGAGLLATLATFTLAHGCVVWPIGAAMLARAGRWRALAGWGVLGALALAVFLTGFQIYSSHRLTDLSAEGLGRLATYWLALLGGPLTFGDRASAPFFGLILLGLLGWLGARDAWRREPVLVPVVLFTLGSLSLIAVGRLNLAGPQIESRYLVLGSLAWALVAFMLLEIRTEPARPFRLLVWCLPALIAFNLAANSRGHALADSWIESRDRAVTRYKQHGEDGRGPFSLHPKPTHSTELLAQAERQGIYRLPPVCFAKAFPEAKPDPAIRLHVDEATVSARSFFVRGWAAMPGRPARRGQIHLVLKNERTTHVFTTISTQRPDVAEAHAQPRWLRSGFRFVLRHELLPVGEFQIGVLIDDGHRARFVMTDHRVRLGGERQVRLASDF